MHDEYDDFYFKDYPLEVYSALKPFTDPLPKEERRAAAHRVLRYLELVIEQVDEEIAQEQEKPPRSQE